MKRIFFIVSIGLVIFFFDTQSLGAKSSYVIDYFYIGASGGYSTLIGKTPNMNVLGSGNYGLHIGYEYRRGLFLLRGCGNLQGFHSRCSTQISIPDIIFNDQKGTDATMHYDMLSPLKENVTCYSGGITVMAGYSENSSNAQRLDERGGFYALGGFSLMYGWKFYSNVSLDYSLSATYSEYIDDYMDMPNHYYTEQHSEAKTIFNQKDPIKNISILVSAEIGWEWNLIRCTKVKLGMFFDCGILNVMRNNGTNFYYPNNDNITQFIVNSYYNSLEMKGKYVVPLLVGVRVGVSLVPKGDLRNCRSLNCQKCYSGRKY